MSAMSYPGGFASQEPRGRIDLAVLTEAIDLIKNNLNPFIIFTLIAFAPILLISIGWYIFFFAAIFAAGSTSSSAFFVTFFVSYPVLFIAIYACMGFAYGGLTQMLLVAFQGKAPTVQDGTSALQLVVPLALLGMAYGILTGLGVIACIIGMFVVGGLLMPAYAVMIIEKRAVVDSLKRSLELTRDHWLMAAATYFIANLVLGVAGNCLILIPLVFPWMVAVNFLVYRDLAGLSYQPTSPTAYPRTGGGYMPEYVAPADPFQDPAPSTTENNIDPEEPTSQ